MVVAGRFCRMIFAFSPQSFSPPKKTARDNPAPSTTPERRRAKSAFANERRRRRGQRTVEIPAHAELEVVRGDVVHGPRILRDRGAGEVAVGAGGRIAQVHVAVSELDGDARRDMVGKAGVQ